MNSGGSKEGLKWAKEDERTDRNGSIATWKSISVGKQEMLLGERGDKWTLGCLSLKITTTTEKEREGKKILKRQTYLQAERATV